MNKNKLILKHYLILKNIIVSFMTLNPANDAWIRQLDTLYFSKLLEADLNRIDNHLLWILRYYKWIWFEQIHITYAQ